jgi:hypothetical protein
MRDHATLIVAEKMDRDLSGVPFRWLKLRNGGILRTYDMEFPPVSK